MNAYRGRMFNSFNSGFSSTPSAIKTIVIINAVVFVLQLVFGSVLIEWFGYKSDAITTFTQPWRMVTYMFLHSGGWHILFNMLWLWWMGKQIEMDLGPKTFTSIYLFSGIAGVIFNLALTPFFANSIVIGASGAVYGIMVAFAVLYPRAPIMLFLLPPLEARFVVGGIIALDVLFMGAQDNVARLVHLGGALGGFLLIKAVQKGYSISTWLNIVEYYGDKIIQVFKKTSPKRTTRTSNLYSVSDATIIEEYDQTELDRILDKIAKQGYEGLTSEEKKTLFEISKKQ